MQDHKHEVSDSGHSHNHVDKYFSWKREWEWESDGDDGRLTGSDAWSSDETIGRTDKSTTGITVEGVSSGYNFGSETRPKNMNVIFIMRVW